MGCRYAGDYGLFNSQSQHKYRQTTNHTHLEHSVKLQINGPGTNIPWIQRRENSFHSAQNAPSKAAVIFKIWRRLLAM